MLIPVTGSDSTWLFQSEEKWDKQWAAGQWSYMDTVPVERSKVAVVGVLADMYANTSSSDPMIMGLLDVGCGEGSLSDFLPQRLRDNYVGTDISKEAIATARIKRPSLKFVHSAAHRFTPRGDRKFQAITFADMLYYVDHKSLMQQYNDYLADDGIVIISIFFTKQKKDLYNNIWKDAASIFHRIDAMEISGTTKKKAHDAEITETDTAFRIEVFRRR